MTPAVIQAVVFCPFFCHRRAVLTASSGLSLEMSLRLLATAFLTYSEGSVFSLSRISITGRGSSLKTGT